MKKQAVNPFRIPKGTYPIYLRFVGKGKADLIEFTLENP